MHNVIIGVLIYMKFFCAGLSFRVIVDFVVNSDLGFKRSVARKQCSMALQNMPLALTCSD